MSHSIFHRHTGEVLFASETAKNMKEAVTMAVRAGVNLAGANLTGVNLTGADLQRANLAGADLAEANLVSANLTRTNLIEANLAKANLVSANLAEADLWEANLVDANLMGANLWRADLLGADLLGANLKIANLTRADFTNTRGLSLPILQIAGSRHWVVAQGADEVWIGCRVHPLTWWLKHHKTVGRQAGYSEAQITEYGAHLEYVRTWLSVVRQTPETK